MYSILTMNLKLKKPMHFAVGVIFMLVGAVLVPYLFQASYAAYLGSSPSLRFFKIKVALDKSVVRRGQEQSIKFSVEDSNTHQPLGGAITRATVIYPAGTPVKDLSTFTDSSGHSTISWQTERNAPLDTYDVDYDVVLQGYNEVSHTISYAVVSHDGGNGHYHHNQHNDNNNHSDK